MSDLVARRVSKIFAERARVKDMALLQNGIHRERYRKLEFRCDRARDRETRQYNDYYDARMAAERRRVGKEAGEIHRRHVPPGMGEDRFDKSNIELIAKTRVDRRHARRLGQIESFRNNAKADLLREVRQAKQVRGEAKAAFKRAIRRER